jgi:metal-responsive CopG/Arc/MetJ family transcriptional regulator
MYMKKTPRNAFEALGIRAPESTKDAIITVRLTEADAEKLDALVAKLGVRGRSTLARLILERFIAEHAQKGKA